jgi:hypothetical protein
MSKGPSHRHGVAISCLNVKVQNIFQHPAHKNIKQLPNCKSPGYVPHERQMYELKQLRNKLQKHNSILTHSNKGKMTIIVNNDTSQQK